ncbi:MAG TPA: hypothetical protein VKA09_10825 [Nitrososphaeraceae archaeon]|nr:hypothetical protein [Nitrososphaeraceae archaeon]
MEQELQKRVLAIARRTSWSMRGRVQPSLSEDDMKHYLQEVLNEIRKA